MTGGRLSVLAAAVLWGTAGVAAALGPSQATVWQIATLRLGVGAPLLLLVSSLGGGPRRFPRPVSAAALAGTALAAFQVAYFAAVLSVGVALGTAVAIGSAPVAAGALQWLVLRERPDPSWWVATVLAVSGVVLLLGSSGGVAGSTAGVLAGLAAGSAFATFTVASHRILDGSAETSAAMGWVLLAAAAPLAVLAVVMTVITGAEWAWTFSRAGAATLSWLVVAATSVAYLAFARGLARVHPASAATLTLAEPLTAVVLGLGVLAERPTLRQGVGVALVLAGLIVVLAPRDRSRRGRSPIARGPS